MIMTSIQDAYEIELEQRIAELELADNQGEPLRWADFLGLATLTLLIPLAGLLLGWFL
jgi:hypothetical protein